jgi:hypothetical protein
MCSSHPRLHGIAARARSARDEAGEHHARRNRLRDRRIQLGEICNRDIEFASAHIDSGRENLLHLIGAADDSHSVRSGGLGGLIVAGLHEALKTTLVDDRDAVGNTLKLIEIV